VGSAITNCQRFIEGEWVEASIDDRDPDVVDDAMLEVTQLKAVGCFAGRS